jgi:two-component system sensor histidine kinase RegB
MGLGVYLTQMTLARLGGELSISNHADGGALTFVRLRLDKLRIHQSLSGQH